MPQSMDRFGPVSVDYFHGRRVEKVDDNPEEGVWEICFEGGGVIRNYDPSVPMPTTITGAGLTRTILSKDSTRLQFGLEEVTLNPLEYSIIDKHYTRGEEVFAQRSDYNMPPEIPPHPDERVIEEPLPPNVHEIDPEITPPPEMQEGE